MRAKGIFKANIYYRRSVLGTHRWGNGPQVPDLSCYPPAGKAWVKHRAVISSSCMVPNLVGPFFCSATISHTITSGGFQVSSRDEMRKGKRKEKKSVRNRLVDVVAILRFCRASLTGGGTTDNLTGSGRRIIDPRFEGRLRVHGSEIRSLAMERVDYLLVALWGSGVA